MSHRHYKLSLIDLVYQFHAESAKKHADYDHGVPNQHHALSDDRSMDTIHQAAIDVSLVPDVAQPPGDFVLFLEPFSFAFHCPAASAAPNRRNFFVKCPHGDTQRREHPHRDAIR